MDFKHYRTFILAAEELHLGRTAERLGIAQPAVTQQIQTLEASLGFKVFHRVRRGIQLTDGGAAFLEQARTALATAEAAVLAGRRASRGETGRLSIAYVNSAMLEAELPALLRRLNRAQPGLTLSLRGVAVHEQIAALADESIDVAFLRAPLGQLPDVIRVQSFSRSPLDAVLPRNHALASKRRIPLNALATDRFVLVNDPPGVGLGHRTRELCREAGFEPHEALHVSDSVSVVAMVSAGLGVGLVPRSLSRLASEDVLFKPLTSANVFSEILVATRAFDRSAAVAQLMAVMAEGR